MTLSHCKLSGLQSVNTIGTSAWTYLACNANGRLIARRVGSAHSWPWPVKLTRVCGHWPIGNLYNVYECIYNLYNPVHCEYNVIGSNHSITICIMVICMRVHVRARASARMLSRRLVIGRQRDLSVSIATVLVDV